MSTVHERRPDRWPQVSLKGFFALVTLLCVCGGWMAGQLAWIGKRHEALRQYKGLENGVIVATPHFANRPKIQRGECAKAPWSIGVLGEHGIKTLIVNYDAGEELTARAYMKRWDAEKKRLANLFPEAEIVPAHLFLSDADSSIPYAPPGPPTWPPLRPFWH